MIWGALVAALGGALGVWLVARARGGVAAAGTAAVSTQRLAELRDEHQRQLAELRRDDLTRGDRAELEIAAARTLKEIDDLGALQGAPAAASATPEDSPATAPPPRRSTWIGFAWGVGVSAAIVALLLMAGGDSRSRREGEPITGGDSIRPGMEVPADFEHPGAEVPPEAQAQLDDLERRWSEDGDLAALKELTLGNLALERFMQAHRWSQVILEQDPNDPDGQYAQGVVRMAMGQSDAAVEYFDRVLAGYPNHLLALVAKGAALRGAGRIDAARATWEQALLVSGNQPQIRQLLADLDQPVATTPTPATRPAPTSAAVGQVDPAAAYRVALTCTGTRPQAQTLFVILRSSGATAGPPTAVRRLDQPALPLELVLGQADSMMGAELPLTASLTARWDADGNAMTREDLPEVSAEAKKGGAVALEVCP